MSAKGASMNHEYLQFPTYPLYTVRRTLFGVQCTAYSVRRTVYGVQCTAYSVQTCVFPRGCAVAHVGPQPPLAEHHR